MKSIRKILALALAGTMITGVCAYSEEATGTATNTQTAASTQIAMPNTSALVEQYYAALAKLANKEALTQAATESQLMSLYYAALASEATTNSSVYAQLAEYYKAVAQTENINSANAANPFSSNSASKNTSKNTSSSNTGKRSSTGNDSSKAKTSYAPGSSSYSYDQYGYISDGSWFVVNDLILTKWGSYFVDQYGEHYSIDEKDIVYGINKIESETGKSYSIVSIEESTRKHKECLKDKNNYSLYLGLSTSE